MFPIERNLWRFKACAIFLRLQCAEMVRRGRQVFVGEVVGAPLTPHREEPAMAAPQVQGPLGVLPSAQTRLPPPPPLLAIVQSCGGDRIPPLHHLMG